MSDPNLSSWNRLKQVSRRAALLLLLVPGLPVLARAQATTATAIRRADLQVGAGFSGGKSGSYGQSENPYASVKMAGFGLYATYDFRPHLGVEFDFHQIHSANGEHAYERTYELGPRYVVHLGRFNPYARVMYGRGVFNFPDVNGQLNANLAYNMVVGGAGVDVNLRKHINVRAEYEYQHWFSFPLLGSIAPQVGTVSAAYHF